MALAKKKVTKVTYKKGGTTRSEKVYDKSEKTAAKGNIAVKAGKKKKGIRLLKKAARQENRSIKIEDKEMGRPKFKAEKKPMMKKGGAVKAFKPHMMYNPKTGKGTMAKKMIDHLRMKKLGFGHTKPKK